MTVIADVGAPHLSLVGWRMPLLRGLGSVRADSALVTPIRSAAQSFWEP